MYPSSNRFVIASCAAGVLALAVGLVVLVGWWQDIMWLKSIVPGWATMKVNTALGFVLTGVALLLSSPPANLPRAIEIPRWVASVVAALAAAVGFLTLVEYQTGIDLNIDQWLLHDLPADVHATHPGRMAPATALNFLMLGTALVLLNFRFAAAVVVSQSLALATLFVGVVAVTGYGYGVAAMYRFTATSSMALHTASLFVVMGVGTLLARPNHGFVAAVADPGSGGAMARRVLPWIVMLPLFTGWLSLWSVQNEWLQTEFGFAIFAVSCVVILATVVVRHAQKLNVTDAVLREHADQAKNAELRFSKIIETAPSAMIMVDARGQISLVNAQAEKLFGYTSAELLQQPIDILVPEGARVAHAAYRDDYIRNPQPRVMGAGRDLYGRHKEGREIPIEIGLSPFTTADGAFVIAMVNDISARKRAEEEQQALVRQLHQAQKMETVGRLSAGIAHDFNNILASVLGYTELALDTQVPDKNSTLAGYLRQVEQAGNRARNLVANLLTFTRRGGVAPQPVELGPLVKEVVSLLVSTLPSSIEFVTRMEAPDAIVSGDPARLHQVIMNLTINARDALGEHGRIELVVREVRDMRATCASCGARVVGDFVELAVKDSGPGILPDVVLRIFEPFFTTKSTGKGTGMGLSVVHGVVHDCGGHVLVESTQGAGTVIRALLPRAESLVDIDEAQTAVPLLQSGGGRILVVDDEEALAQLSAAVLKENGYRVSVFSSSVRALEQFRATPAAFDAVMSDQTMPGLTGVELTQAIRALRPELPIILCTGYSATLNQSVAAELQVELLSKPVQLSELLRTLHAVMTASRNARATHKV